MINGLSEGIVAKPIDWMLKKTVCKEGFPLIIELRDQKSIAKRLEELLKLMSKSTKVVIARFKGQLGKTSTNDFVENCITREDKTGHGHPNKNAIIKKADVGTNLMMNGIGKRRSAGLESENSKNMRIVVLTINSKSKVLSFLTFPFLFCN